MKNLSPDKVAPLIDTAERLHSLNNSLSLLIIINMFIIYIIYILLKSTGIQIANTSSN